MAMAAEENFVLPIKFSRCDACGSIGAVRVAANQFACRNPSRCIRGGGGGGVPGTSATETDFNTVRAKVESILYDDTTTNDAVGLTGPMVADAVNWLSLVPDDIHNRHRNLLALVNAYRLNSAGPYSGQPLPIDAKLYNIMVVRARHYARSAIDALSEVVTPTEAEDENRSRVRETRHNPDVESDVSAHGETLFLLYVTMWRGWLASYDLAMAAVTATALNVAPLHNPMRAATGDTLEALRLINSVITSAVRRLFDEYNMSKATIKRFLIDGLLERAEPDSFASVNDQLLPAASEIQFGLDAPTAAAMQKEGRMPDMLAASAAVDRLTPPDAISEAMASGSDAEFIQAVAAANDGVLDWIKSKARRVTGKARNLSSSKAYDAFTLADLLYRLYVVNLCTPDIAISTGLYVPALHAETPQGGQPINEAMSYFRPRYETAYLNGRVQGDNPSWINDFTRLIGEVGSRGERSNREQRVLDYTCGKSSNGRFQLTDFNLLPAKIAKQVSAMAAYYYSYDPKDAKSSERRMQNTAKDMISLVRELRRKVGTDAARVLLREITPVYK